MSSVVCMGLGCLCLAVAFAHEYAWFVRRKWKRTVGKIVGFVEDRTDRFPIYHPRVEVDLDGTPMTFASTYGQSSKPVPGSRVRVVVPPKTGRPEVLSLANRFLPTWVPLGFAILLIAVGLGLL